MSSSKEDMKDIKEEMPDSSKVDCLLGEFEGLHLLCNGTYGSNIHLVRKCRGSDNGNLYAMKTFSKKYLRREEEQYHIVDVLNEHQLLILNHRNPYSNQLFYAFQSPKGLHLVLEYLALDFFTYFNTNNNKLQPSSLKTCIAQLLYALNYLHSNQIIYRDVKLENTMISFKGHPVLIDFGLGIKCKDDAIVKGRCGTSHYMAPEIINGKSGYSYSVDFWSVGIMIHEMVSKSHPFGLTCKTSKSEMDKMVLTNQPKLENSLPKTLRKMVCCLLNKDPLKRLGNCPNNFNEIQNQSYLNNIEWDKIINKTCEPPFKDIVVDKDLTKTFNIFNVCKNSKVYDDEKFEQFAYTNPDFEKNLREE